ncbi:hypothetical protein SeMB42_g05617 [Synchytrium endobioticum]|uniref:Ribosomal RNA-processing protein 8 n=1 Tax=Synchytrium endobioticum TaxID=286115 RepID=A0A507DG74_9FUNG|nr:hypothetical protein SeMB42_g05617 [Synchytrium endobioticum]TPX50603.1 hypothetical protein SeLEV6574_g00811 [Synchytrium endobioticum]
MASAMTLPNFASLWSQDANQKKRPAPADVHVLTTKKIRPQEKSEEKDTENASALILIPKKLHSLKAKLKQALAKSQSRPAAVQSTTTPSKHNNRTSANGKTSTTTPLQKKPAKPKNKHAQKLVGAEFRWINEQLYTIPSAEAVDLFKGQPSMFDVYHEGFRSQTQSWPLNPLDVIIDSITQKIAKNSIIADLGCGDAKLAQKLRDDYTVHSFDMISKNEHVTACDIAHVPLDNASVDAVVICLALMGTNWIDFVQEAVRILKKGGKLKIAEVASRFVNVDEFIKLLSSRGLKLKSKDVSNTHFILFEFAKKGQSTNYDNIEEASTLLKPCVYKKR